MVTIATCLLQSNPDGKRKCPGCMGSETRCLSEAGAGQEPAGSPPNRPPAASRMLCVPPPPPPFAPRSHAAAAPAPALSVCASRSSAAAADLANGQPSSTNLLNRGEMDNSLRALSFSGAPPGRVSRRQHP